MVLKRKKPRQHPTLETGLLFGRSQISVGGKKETRFLAIF